MKKVLVRPNEIVKVIEKEDCCIVVMENDKVWVCARFFRLHTDKPHNYDYANTADYIEGNKTQPLVRLVLKGKGV